MSLCLMSGPLAMLLRLGLLGSFKSRQCPLCITRVDGNIAVHLSSFGKAINVVRGRPNNLALVALFRRSDIQKNNTGITPIVQNNIVSWESQCLTTTQGCCDSFT